MTTDMPGLLISCDGVDSSGKETQVNELVKRLRFQGHVVRQFATPDYNTPIGKEIKLRLQNKIGTWDTTPWEDKMKLFAANRLEHRAEVITALQRGEIVIYDRYVPSSITFIAVEALHPQEMDFKRSTIQQAVTKHEYEANAMPKEHTSIFLDVPPNVSTKLLEKRKEILKDEDEYSDHIDVQNRLYNEYMFLNENNPDHYTKISCVTGTQMLGIDEVAELVWEALIVKFPHLHKQHASET